VCWIPGFEAERFATPFPDLYSGVGLTCRALEPGELPPSPWAILKKFVEIFGFLRDL
jgi:hypothetical protein